MPTPRKDQGLSPNIRVEKISSPQNSAIKLIKSLHSKKGRAETGLFLAEGARLIAEAADLGYWPKVLAFATAALERPMAVELIIKAAAAGGVRLIETSEAILAAASKRDNPQTMIAAYPRRLAELAELNPARSGIWVGLEGVRDPGNLGTIIRTADAVGAGGVILIGQTCDPFSVEAVRATMGSLFAVPLARAEFEALNVWRRAGGLRLAGASLKGALRHDAPPSTAATLILMGNEQSGLPPELEAACDDLVRIPMRGRADSLNLAAATAVMLYETWRRQGYPGADR